MPNPLRALLVLLLLAGCSSSTPQAFVLEPEIRMAQLSGSTFIMRYQGRLTIQYLLEVKNLSGERIDLKRIELRVMGQAPYRLQPEAIPTKLSIPAGEISTVQLNVLAWSEGGTVDPNEHIAIRGIAHFDSPAGNFRTNFTQVLRQPDATGPR